MIFSTNYTVLWSITFSEKIYTWLLDEKPIHYKISDTLTCIFIDELILIDKLNAKTHVEILHCFRQFTATQRTAFSSFWSNLILFKTLFWDQTEFLWLQNRYRKIWRSLKTYFSVCIVSKRIPDNNSMISY